MLVNVAVLRETLAHEHRVALVPALVPRLTALGARIHLQAGAGHGIAHADSAHGAVEVASRIVIDSAPIATSTPRPELAVAVR